MFQRSIESILKGFSKTITALENLESRNQTEIFATDDKIDELSRKRDDLIDEVERAHTVAARLREIINYDEQGV